MFICHYNNPTGHSTMAIARLLKPSVYRWLPPVSRLLFNPTLHLRSTLLPPADADRSRLGPEFYSACHVHWLSAPRYRDARNAPRSLGDHNTVTSLTPRPYWRCRVLYHVRRTAHTICICINTRDLRQLSYRAKLFGTDGSRTRPHL